MQATIERLQKRREERSDEGGFTLIELLIVIVILAILAAIVVFAVQNLTSTSAKSSCKADFKTVESSVEAFKAQNGAYPGGTYNSGITVTSATSPGTGQTNAGILALLGTNNQTPQAGPWLKDYPFNSGHYQIQVSTDGKGTVTVWDTAGTPNQLAPAGVAGTPATNTATNSAADCGGVN
jgi:prepilin-type N-terminal cleavage/methylation domain-containing protein